VREIALLVEEGDIGDLGALKALMVEKLALEPNTIKFAGSAPKDQMRLARTLSGCEQCVIFWARQAEEWVLDLLASEALAAHLGRGRMCIYAAAPLTPEKASFHSAKARIILAADGPNEADLQVFFGANPIAA
jgi:hypothetical protein